MIMMGPHQKEKVFWGLSRHWAWFTL